MSGMLDTVIVTCVPGGPELGEIETFGLAKVLRSEVAQTVLRSGNMINPTNPIMAVLLNFFKNVNYD